MGVAAGRVGSFRVREFPEAGSIMLPAMIEVLISTG